MYKIQCSCGYETDWRCRIHTSRAGHICYGQVKLCHECAAEAERYVRSGLTHAQAGLKLLEKQFILCPGCAHEMAILEDAERATDAFWQSLPRGEQFLAEAVREVDHMLGVIDDAEAVSHSLKGAR